MGYPSISLPFGISVGNVALLPPTTIASDSTMSDQVQLYGDLTINAGVKLSAGFSVQVLIAKSITFGDSASKISADGMGAPLTLGTALAGAGGVGGGSAGNIVLSQLAANMPADPLQMLAQGGLGGKSMAAPQGTGTAGLSPGQQLLLAFLLDPSLIAGLIGGGAGGSGAGLSSLNSALNAAGGVRGGMGANAATGPGGGGGGSGVGAGGGGGGISNAGGVTGTGGNGGAGGGVLLILANQILGSNGIISAKGMPGGNGVGTKAGGGGGGGGGLILCWGDFTTATPTLQVTGGAAGIHVGANACDGGQGSNGLASLITA